MNLRNVYHALVNLGEACDHLAPELLNRDDLGHLSPQDRAAIHRYGMLSRDTATGLENALRSLSDETRQQIAAS
jgi:hypothetical protein